MNRVLVILTFILLFFFQTTGQHIETIAGAGTPGYSGDGGLATSAQLSLPAALATNDAGEIYFADTYNSAIRKISTNGVMSTIAGNGSAGYAGDGSPAVHARLNAPVGLTIDQNSNIYFSDQNNAVIRKISSSGIITTIAGNGKEGYSGDGGKATDAQLYIPAGVVADRHGNIFFADAFNHVVRKIDSNGIISTIAGNGKEGYSGDGGRSTAARLRFPIAVEVDELGDVYIADTHNHVIRKVEANGVITTIAGNGSGGYSGDGGPAATASLNQPAFIRFDKNGNLIIPEAFNHLIRRMDKSGKITTIAGTGVKGYRGDGGSPLDAEFNFPSAVAIDQKGNIFVSDVYNYVIRKIVPCATVVSGSLHVTASAGEICEGERVSFSAMIDDPSRRGTYRWTLNGILLQVRGEAIQLGSLNDGDRVQSIFKADDPCASPVVSNTMQIKVHPNPVVVMDKEIIITRGERVTLNPELSGNISVFSWSPSGGLDYTGIRNPVASPQQSTVYTLQVVSDNGCERKAEIRVTIFKKILMPGVFTPDNNGSNDVFRIPPGVTFNLKQFRIYNRWGQVVFSTSDISRGWDGRKNGMVQEAGMYVYSISGSDTDGDKNYHGTFMLLR